MTNLLCVTLETVVLLLFAYINLAHCFVPKTAATLERQEFYNFNKLWVTTIDTAADVEARSVFGTKDYWDDLYRGNGDFPAHEYSWYFGWNVIGKHIKNHVPKDAQILLPGIGNDPVLLDLLSAGYKHLTAQDYSEHAIERQRDLLSYSSSYSNASVTLNQSDVRDLPSSWTQKFDAVIEKGLLDAVYLSGNGNINQALASLSRVLKPGGVFISISGVVPPTLRNSLLKNDQWQWIRDGSDDLQAGCWA